MNMYILDCTVGASVGVLKVIDSLKGKTKIEIVQKLSSICRNSYHSEIYLYLDATFIISGDGVVIIN